MNDDYTPAKPMTKTKARDHIASARRNLGTVRNMLDPTPQWMQDQGVSVMSDHNKSRVIRQAEADVAALRRAADQEGITL